jgi:hypothetical protein
MFVQVLITPDEIMLEKLRVGQYKNREFDLHFGPVLKVPYNDALRWLRIQEDIFNFSESPAKWFKVVDEIERMLPEFYSLEEEANGEETDQENHYQDTCC